MNIIITINGEDVAITRREAHILYNQLNQSLFWEDKEASKKEETKDIENESYSIK